MLLGVIYTEGAKAQYFTKMLPLTLHFRTDRHLQLVKRPFLRLPGLTESERIRIIYSQIEMADWRIFLHTDRF